MSALLGEAYVADAMPREKSLEEHDKAHHPGGYHEGDTCKFRDKMKEETPEDQADELSFGNRNRQSSKDNKQQGKLKNLANRIKGFIKGVKIRFSETPYQEDGREVRKSIKESEQKHWNKILDAFENKTAGADATFHHKLLDHTPAVLQRLGVKDLPITIRGGIIHKMIGNIRNSEYDYHEIPISELRNLLIDLDNPVAVFDSKSDPNALVVLTNILDKHGNLKSVVPLKLERDTSGEAKENAIASGYGQKPENLQDWIAEGYLRYVSKKALKKSAQRLQLPGDSILRAKGVLMENDFSAEQLGDIIPDSGAAVKGVDEKKEDVRQVINFRDSKGEVVGTYNRETNEMVVYPGADADTIGHELCGHATWQYAEQQARKGDSRLLEKMQEVVDAPAAKPVWDEVKANYEGEDREVQREEVWAHIIGHETSKAIEEIQKSRSGRRWYQKFWNVVKDAWKGLLSTVRVNSVHLDGTEEMSPKEFSEYIVKQMLEGKQLGTIETDGSSGERKSIRSKKIVTPEEDAAYMEAVEKGDMKTAAKMVREVAGRAFPNTKIVDEDGKPKVVYHNSDIKITTPAIPWEGPIEWDGLPGMFFANREQKQYGVNKHTCYINIENPMDMNAGGNLGLHARSTDQIEKFAKQYEDAIRASEKDFKFGEDGVLEITDKGMSLLKNDGYYGKHPSDDEGEVVEYAVLSPRQVKSADPVTYDDEGKVIPLSRRFDDGDDIRGDVSGKTEYIEKMKSLHPDINPDELIDRLKNLGSRDEMEAEIAKILGKK